MFSYILENTELELAGLHRIWIRKTVELT